MGHIRRLITIGTIVSSAALVGACISMEFGTPLVTDGLNDLELGQSTRAEILLALGQPRGSGVVKSVQHQDPREILFYEFIEADSKNLDLEIMTVFLHNGLYDGHLWFASSARQRMEGGIPGLVAPEKLSAGYFPDPASLEAQFVRGETGREEVLGALQAPTGRGSALLPPDHRGQEVWYYEDIEGSDFVKDPSGDLRMNMRQRILLVMFHEDRFDGFMWYSNQGLTEGRTE